MLNFANRKEVFTLLRPLFLCTQRIYYFVTDRATFNAKLSEKLTETLMTILQHTSSDAGRAAVPPITNSQGISPFPFKISVKVAGVDLG